MQICVHSVIILYAQTLVSVVQYMVSALVWSLDPPEFRHHKEAICTKTSQAQCIVDCGMCKLVNIMRGQKAFHHLFGCLNEQVFICERW